MLLEEAKVLNEARRDSQPGRQIAVIGPAAAVAAFRAGGLVTVPVEEPRMAVETVEELARTGIQVILFTEELLPFLLSALERYRKSTTPTLVALPCGSAQRSVARLQEVVMRAVGVDISARRGPEEAGWW